MIRTKTNTLLIIALNFVTVIFANRCTSHSGRIGTCVSPGDCPVFRNPNFMAFPDHFCNDNRTLFCCERFTQRPRGRSHLRTTTEAPENREMNFEKHPNFKLFNFDVCGKIDDRMRIANGQKVGLFEFPWNAQLGYKNDETNEIEFGCGGSLISDYYVLSAAHCLKTRFNQERIVAIVRLGEHTMSTIQDCQYENGEKICADPIQDVKVKKSIVHTGFTYQGVKNDIVLLQLAEIALSYQNNINPICLPFFTPNIPQKMIVNGFGRTTTSGTRGSDVLMRVAVNLREKSECSKTVRGRTRTIDHTQICAGDSRDACLGDSGSSLQHPAMIQGAIKNIQYGIVSYGLSRECGDATPGVYTNVHSYLSWILDNMESINIYTH